MSILYFNEEVDFKRLNSCMEKVELAVSRLENPYGLTDEMIVMYQNYLFNEAPKIAHQFIDNNRLTMLPLLVKYRVIKKTNVIQLTDYARELKKLDMLSYLMEAGNSLRNNPKKLDIEKKHTPGKSDMSATSVPFDYSNAKAGDIIRSRTFDPFMPLIAVAIIYLVVVVVLTQLVKILERRLRKNER